MKKQADVSSAIRRVIPDERNSTLLTLYGFSDDRFLDVINGPGIVVQKDLKTDYWTFDGKTADGKIIYASGFVRDGVFEMVDIEVYHPGDL